MLPARLQLVRGADVCPERPGTAASDIALLAVLFGLHWIPLVGWALGSDWGRIAIGYSTAVVALTGRELVRELVLRLWRSPPSHA